METRYLVRWLWGTTIVEQDEFTSLEEAQGEAKRRIERCRGDFERAEILEVTRRLVDSFPW